MTADPSPSHVAPYESVEADVVVYAETAPSGDRTKGTRSRLAMPKWEAETRERVKAAIRRFGRPFADLVARDANESGKRSLVTNLLCVGLGWNPFLDVTLGHGYETWRPLVGQSPSPVPGVRRTVPAGPAAV